MASKVLVVVALSFAAVSAQDVVSDCPIPNGFFADSLQCDKYYECQDNVLTERLCPDGKAFNDFNHRIEKCDFLYQIDCKDRPELQPPQNTENCPRANGYFPHHTPGICDEFFFCNEGNGNHLNCPESLVFSLKTGTCVWPDEAGRTDECKSGNVVNFTCPAVPAFEAVAHPRYADPDDCQYFYVCINGKTPRRNGCNFGQVFNSEIATCDSPKAVPECADYYFDYFTQYFAGLEGASPSPEILQAAVTSGFKVPEVAKRVRVRPSSTALSSSDGVRRRRPTLTNVAAPKLTDKNRDSPDRPVSLGQRNEPAAITRPQRRRPSLNRTPSRTPAPATTTPPPPPPPQADTPLDQYDDYYYEDYVDPAAAPADAAPAEPAAQSPAASLSNRFNLRRPSRT